MTPIIPANPFAAYIYLERFNGPDSCLFVKTTVPLSDIGATRPGSILSTGLVGRKLVPCDGVPLEEQIKLLAKNMCKRGNLSIALGLFKPYQLAQASSPAIYWCDDECRGDTAFYAQMEFQKCGQELEFFVEEKGKFSNKKHFWELCNLARHAPHPR